MPLVFLRSYWRRVKNLSLAFQEYYPSLQYKPDRWEDKAPNLILDNTSWHKTAMNMIHATRTAPQPSGWPFIYFCIPFPFIYLFMYHISILFLFSILLIFDEFFYSFKICIYYFPSFHILFYYILRIHVLHLLITFA